MKARVFHNFCRHTMFLDDLEDFDIKDFKVVATVEVEGVMGVNEFLDRVYMLTNSIDCYWGENEGVKCTESEKFYSSAGDIIEGHRSTSVGDVIEVKGHGMFMVAGCGFKAVPKMEVVG